MSCATRLWARMASSPSAPRISSAASRSSTAISPCSTSGWTIRARSSGCGRRSRGQDRRRRGRRQARSSPQVRPARARVVERSAQLVPQQPGGVRCPRHLRVCQVRHSPANRRRSRTRLPRAVHQPADPAAGRRPAAVLDAPEFDQSCRSALGWMPGSLDRYAHDILAVNPPEGPPNMTDVLRVLDERIRARMRSGGEDPGPGDDSDGANGTPVPREPRPPVDGGRARAYRPIGWPDRARGPRVRSPRPPHTTTRFHRPLAKRSAKKEPRTQMSTTIATHAPKSPRPHPGTTPS